MSTVCLIICILKMISVHVTTELAHGVQFAVIEHFAELLELIFAFLGWCNALFLIEHASEGIEIRGVLHETGDVDLGTDEVAKVTTRIKQRRLHEQVHER